MKVLSYQSLFFVPIAIAAAAQTADVTWFETQGTRNPPPARASIEARAAAASGRSQFVAFSLAPVGWEVRSVQPPHPRPERSGAVQFGSAGIEGVQPAAEQPQQPLVSVELLQPPHPRPEKAAAIRLGELRIDGVLERHFPMGWQVRPVQPPHPRVERAGAVQFGSAGIEGVLPAAPEQPKPLVEGPPQPLPRPKLALSALGGRSQFVSFSLAPIGWEVRPFQPPHRGVETRAAAIARGDDGNQAGFAVWFNLWHDQVQPLPQPPYRHAAGVLGEARFDVPATAPPAVVRWGYEPTLTLRRPLSRVSATKGRAHFAIFAPWRNYGFTLEPAPVVKFRGLHRGGAIAVGDGGVAAPFVPPLQTSAYPWHDEPWVYPRKVQLRSDAIGGKSQFVAFSLAPVGWEVQPFQPPHPRVERVGALALGDAGLRGPFAPGLQTADYPWRDEPWVYPRKHFARAAAIMPKSDGNDARFVVWRNDGWQVQAWQPPHRNIERAFAGIARGDDGTQARFVLWRNDGWQVQPWQPPHPRPERSGVQCIGDTGIQARLQLALQTADYRFGYDEPFVFPRKQFARAAAIMPRSDGNDARFVVWRNFGWEIQPFQPPHREPEQKGAAIAPKSDGNDARFVVWRNTGWEIQPFQPPHTRPERSGVQVIGDLGIAAPIPIGLQTVAYPWHDEPWVFPRKHFARAGAIEIVGGYWLLAGFVPTVRRARSRRTQPAPDIRLNSVTDTRFNRSIGSRKNDA